LREEDIIVKDLADLKYRKLIREELDIMRKEDIEKKKRLGEMKEVQKETNEEKE